MKPIQLTDHRLVELLKLLRGTEAGEITCDELLDRVSRYAEAVAWNQPLPSESERIQQHLVICSECREEFDALVKVLQAQQPS